MPPDYLVLVNRAYDGGPYRRGAVDYGQPPTPPLAGELAAWSVRRLREAGFRAPASG